MDIRETGLGLAAILCGVLIAGCGGSDDAADAPVILDTKRVERAIEASVLAKRSVKADVDCPSGVHQGKGLTFNCVATTKSGTTTFVVDQPDGKGNVRYAARP